MQIAGNIDGNNITYSHQTSMAIASILGNGGVISGLDVTTNSVSAGKAIVRCTRTNGQVLMVAYENTAPVTIDTTGTKKVWVEVTQAKIDDGSQNNEDGTGIAQIATGASYPSANFIPLASIVSGVITSEKADIYLTKKRKNQGANKVFATDASGNEVEISGTSGQVVSMTAGGISFVSPTVNIDALAETTATAIDTDEFVVYSAADGVNKKKKMSTYKATTADIKTATATDKFVVAAQMKPRVFWTFFQKVFTAGASNAWTTVLTHNFWRPIVLAEITAYLLNVWGSGQTATYVSNGIYDGTNQNGFVSRPSNGNTVFTGKVFEWQVYQSDKFIGTISANDDNALTITWSTQNIAGSSTYEFAFSIKLFG